MPLYRSGCREAGCEAVLELGRTARAEAPDVSYSRIWPYVVRAPIIAPGSLGQLKSNLRMAQNFEPMKADERNAPVAQSAGLYEKLAHLRPAHGMSRQWVVVGHGKGDGTGSRQYRRASSVGMAAPVVRVAGSGRCSDRPVRSGAERQHQQEGRLCTRARYLGAAVGRRGTRGRMST